MKAKLDQILAIIVEDVISKTYVLMEEMRDEDLQSSNICLVRPLAHDWVICWIKRFAYFSNNFDITLYAICGI